MKTIDKRLVEFTMKIFIQMYHKQRCDFLQKLSPGTLDLGATFPSPGKMIKNKSINVFPCIQCTTPRVFMLTASSLSTCLQG